jgi:hypothetical protein
VLISPRSAMDSDDAEGAELPPVDAKNIAGAGTKRRVDRTPCSSRLSNTHTLSQIEPHHVAARKRSSPRSRRIEPPLWDALEHDVGYCIVAFLGWGTPGRRDKNAKSLRRLLFLAVHSSVGFAAVSRHLSRGWLQVRGPPGRRRFHVPWSWLRAYAFANYSAGTGLILHGALRAAGGHRPPVTTSRARLAAAATRACRGCGAATRPNPPREEQVGAPPGSRTCRGCLCNPRFKRIFHADMWRIRGGLDLTDREWRRLSAALRARVRTWRDGRYGCTLYPYKRTMDFFRKHRHLF